MSKKFSDIKLGLDEDLEEKLQWLSPDYGSYHILKKSVDARKKKDVHFVYSLEVFDKAESIKTNSYPVSKVKYSGAPVVIIGAGPAGLFAALRLVERGVPCTLIEQGSETVKRIKSINRFWRNGELDEKNNVCFGEGGAGLFSDGKLITRIKSPYIPYVLHRLVQFGAPEEIKYLANPHMGSDKLRRIIPPMREYLKQNGCQVKYDTKVTEILSTGTEVTGIKTQSGETIHSEHIILACGHSSNDMFDHLKNIGVFIEGKSFAIGLRVEHPQALIDQIQYKSFSGHPKLGTANYKLTHHDHKTNTGVYSFCMCPGGYVLSCATEPNTTVCNGMSNFKRNSNFANSAVVVSIDHKKTFGENNTFAGMEYRKKLEQSAYNAVIKAGGSKQLPAQKLTDFIEGKLSPLSKVSSPSGAVPVRLDQVLPPNITEFLTQGLMQFSNSMKGFIDKEAQLFGVESRTSCPLRITRDPVTLHSISHKGLYPTGEGAGYAGGITSAACDGIKVVESIIEQVCSQKEHSVL